MKDKRVKMSKDHDGCSETENNDCLVPTCMRRFVVRFLKNKDKPVSPPK